MANIEQASDKSEALQQAIDNGEVMALSLHRGRGQNQNTRIFDLDPVLDQALAGQLRIDDIEKAASLIGGGDFTLASQLSGGSGFGPKYSFKIAMLRDQAQKEQLIQQYGINITTNNPNMNKQNNNGGTYKSIFNPQVTGQQTDPQVAQLLQMLGLRQQQQPNDVLSALTNLLAPSNVTQLLQHNKTEIDNIVSGLKREFETYRNLKDREALDLKAEMNRRESEHKKELQELTKKYEDNIREISNKLDNQIKDIQRDHRDEIKEISNRYTYELKDMKSDFDRRISEMNSNQQMSLIKMEANGGNKSNDFLEKWMLMNQQEKIEVTKQLAESKLAADQIGSKQLELFINSQNNNPMMAIMQTLLAKSLEQKNDPSNLKYMETIIGFVDKLKGAESGDSSKWDKLVEYGAPILGKVAEGALSGFMNKNAVKPPLANPQFMGNTQMTPSYTAPTAQPPVSYQMPVTPNTNITPFPKAPIVNPQSIVQQQQTQTAVPIQTIQEPQVEVMGEEPPEINPNDLMLEWQNADFQNFLQTRVFPIFVAQTDPRVISSQLYEAVGGLEESGLCPNLMEFIHTLEDELEDGTQEAFNAVFQKISILTMAMQIQMNDEQAQKTMDILACYSIELKKPVQEEAIK